jgi:hypothetical protein
VELATYMQTRKLYINLTRNMYKNIPEYNEMITRMFQGQEFTFATVSGYDTKSIGQADTTGEDISGRAIKARKQKNYD